MPLYNHYDVEGHSSDLMNTSTLHYISISMLNADQHLVAQRRTLLILDTEIRLLVMTSASDIMPSVALQEPFFSSLRGYLGLDVKLHSFR